MAAFSYQHQPFLLDPVFPPTQVPSFMEEEGNIYTNCFSQFYTPEPVPESNLLGHTSKVVPSDDNEPSSVTRKQSTDSSTVVDKIESGEQVTQNVSQMGRKRKSRNGAPLDSDPRKDTRGAKGKKPEKDNSCMKDEEKEAKTKKKDQKKGSEEPPTGYIHVRARRGQATDSHSLAERVRREKISERMKILQGLVPGGDKVTGKAQMLDEIINYVQSLQNQVEFLSMKLASLNPLFYDFGMDLDAFMVRPDQILMNCIASPLPPLQQCNPTQDTAFADTTTTFTPPNNYALIDASPSLLLQSQDNGNVMWDMDDQRQKFLSSSVFSDSLCSFH